MQILFKGKPFLIGGNWGSKPPTSHSLQPRLRPYFVGSCSLLFSYLGQTTSFNNLSHTIVVRCWTRWPNEFNVVVSTWEQKKLWINVIQQGGQTRLTSLNTTSLCDVDRDRQTRSTLFFWPPNKIKVEPTLNGVAKHVQHFNSVERSWGTCLSEP